MRLPAWTQVQYKRGKLGRWEKVAIVMVLVLLATITYAGYKAGYLVGLDKVTVSGSGYVIDEAGNPNQYYIPQDGTITIVPK